MNGDAQAAGRRHAACAGSLLTREPALQSDKEADTDDPSRICLFVALAASLPPVSWPQPRDAPPAYRRYEGRQVGGADRLPASAPPPAACDKILTSFPNGSRT